MAIYANQGLRSGLYAMEQAFKAILADGTTANIEGSLWPTSRVHEDLQGIRDAGPTPTKAPGDQTPAGAPCSAGNGKRRLALDRG